MVVGDPAGEGFDVGAAGGADAGGSTAGGAGARGAGWQAGSRLIIKMQNSRKAATGAPLKTVFFTDLNINNPYFTRDSAIAQLMFLRKASM